APKESDMGQDSRPAAAVPVSPLLDDPSPRARILIVEDDPQAGKQLQRLLEAEFRLSVTAVEDCRKALRLLEAERFSLLLTDLRRRDMDGLELVQELQRRRAPVTAVVMTAFGGVDEAVRAIRLGAYDFVTKPIDVEPFKLLVARALRERAMQDELAAL